MNPIDTVESTRNITGEPTESSSTGKPSIERSLSQLRIDAGLSTVRPEIQGSSGTATPAGASVFSMSQQDRTRHDAAVSQSIKRHYQPIKLNKDPRSVARTKLNFDLLKRHLSEHRYDNAIELFGSIADSLCAEEFRQAGRSLLPKIFEHIDKATPGNAALAWYGAAQLHEITGNVQLAVNAYACALKALNEVPTQSHQYAETVRKHLQELCMPAETRLTAAQDQLDGGDADNADAELMTAMSHPLSPRQQVRCLRLAGDIASMQENPASAAAHYHACISHALHIDDVESDVASAKAAFEKLPAQSHALGSLMFKDSQEALDSSMIESAFRCLDADEFKPAISLYDDVIPRLEQRNDMTRLVDVLMQRVKASNRADDGQKSQLSLKLAQACFKLDRHSSTAYCLDAVLREPDAIHVMGTSLEIAAPLLAAHEMHDAAQWCRDASASLQKVDEDDVDVFFKHISTLLESLPIHAAAQAMYADFEPMLDHAEALVDHADTNDVPVFFARVLSKLRAEKMDTRPAEQALETRMKEAVARDQADCISAEIGLNMAEHDILVNDFRGAAEHLRKVLDIELEDQPLLERDCLYCAARLAIFTGKAYETAYMAEAAALFEAAHNDGAVITPEELAARLPDGWDEKLDVVESEAAQKQARADADAEPDFKLIFDRVNELIDHVIQANPERSAQPRRPDTIATR